jgi:molybdopterin molybdotransferase
MLGYLDALNLILAQAQPLSPVTLPLLEALGLATAEDLRSAEPVPPFTNSAMDGFAIRTADAGLGRLPVQGVLSAGADHLPALVPATAMRIMTGAPLPPGADVILPFETVTVDGDWIILAKVPQAGTHVRQMGEDIPAGGLVVPAGEVLRPAHIGALAAIGYPIVPVRPRPRVAVITTGNELVDASVCPGPGKIRDSNSHALCAQVQAAGGVPRSWPRVEDRREAVAATLREALAEADVLLTVGGVSVGDFDFVKPVLEELGAERVFWRIAQKPGSPMGLWLLHGKLIFGIPGNPASAMIMFETYVRPALRRMMGYRNLFRPERLGILDQAWKRSGNPMRTEFLRVVARAGEGAMAVTLAGAQGSGILTTMMRANALAVIPEGPAAIEAGGEVTVQLLEEAEDH